MEEFHLTSELLLQAFLGRFLVSHRSYLVDKKDAEIVIKCIDNF